MKTFVQTQLVSDPAAAPGTVVIKADVVDDTPIPSVLAILPMRNLVLFPGTVAPLNIGRHAFDL